MDTMTKVMPNSAEAEKAILGVMLLYPSEAMRILDVLQKDDFYNPRHQIIFQAIEIIYYERQIVDSVILTSYLKETSQIVQAGGLEYIADITDGIYSKSNLDQYIGYIRDKSLLRKLIATSSDVVNNCYNSGEKKVSDLLEYAEKKILEISKLNIKGEFTRLSATLDSTLEKLRRRADISTEGLTGLKTGYSDLDKITLGLQNDDLIILAARPAMGKTAFALDLCKRVAADSYNKKPYIAFFSLEMSVEQLSLRMIANASNIESYALKKMSLSNEEKNKLVTAKETLSNLNIFLDDTPGIKISDIKTKCRKIKADNKLDLVIIDYLQLIVGDGKYGSNRQLEVSEISRSLKELARELKIPVIALSQLSRTVETRDSKRPIMSDLRESGSIEQDADIVAFLYRDDYYNEESEFAGTVEVILGKHRHGETGKVRLTFKKEYGEFSDFSPIEESDY